MNCNNQHLSQNLPIQMLSETGELKLDVCMEICKGWDLNLDNKIQFHIIGFYLNYVEIKLHQDFITH